jgi:hypothetical protein
VYEECEAEAVVAVHGAIVEEAAALYDAIAQRSHDTPAGLSSVLFPEEVPGLLQPNLKVCKHANCQQMLSGGCSCICVCICAVAGAGTMCMFKEWELAIQWPVAMLSQPMAA